MIQLQHKNDWYK